MPLLSSSLPPSPCFYRKARGEVGSPAGLQAGNSTQQLRLVPARNQERAAPTWQDGCPNFLGKHTCHSDLNHLSRSLALLKTCQISYLYFPICHPRVYAVCLTPRTPQERPQLRGSAKRSRILIFLRMNPY